MAKEFHRSDRVAEELRRVLSEAIRSELDDPRLRLVTITEVRVSRDLSHAKVYLTTMEDGQEEAVRQSLTRAGGFLRGVAGRKLVMRVVPEFRFVIDDRMKQGDRLRSLIDKAVAGDRPDDGEDKPE